jgi:DNA polymerase I-like protein with 3'-5' exonuclease and polymerase domains
MQRGIKRAVDAGITCAGQCHDEILAVADGVDAERTREALLEAMETPIPWWPSITLFAEAGYGSNWLEAKK